MAAKQTITITGLGSKEFEAAARAVLQIHTLFASTMPENTIVPWTPMRDTDHICLEFANRYFKGKGDDDATVVALGNDIDPMGLLRSRCNEGEHTEDNAVLYYRRITDPNTG